MSFMRALVEATEVINKDRKRAAKDVSDFLKNLDPQMVEQLMTKLTFDMELEDSSIAMLKLAESPAQAAGEAHQAGGLQQLHLPGALARGAAEEGELQAVGRQRRREV